MHQLILLALALPVPQDSQAERLTYDVAPGTVLHRDLTVRHEIQLDGVTITRGDNPPQHQETPGWVSSFFKLVVDDTIQEVVDDRPTKLQRTWKNLGGEATLRINPAEGRPKQSDRAMLSSPLRHRRVDFTWIESESDWARLWVRDDAEEFWLAELRGDMDVLGLMPAAPVEPGAQWELSLETVRSMLAPGGNNLITPFTTNVFGRTVEFGLGGDYSEVLGPDLIGTALARFTGVRVEDGERLAAIEVEISGLRSISDRTDLWRTSAPPEEREEVTHLVSALVEYELTGRGEALWNLDRGHLQRIELTGDEVYMLTVTKEGGRVDNPVEVMQQSSFHGNVELTYTVGPPRKADEQPAEADRDH